MNQGQFITERASAALRRLTRRRSRRDSDEDIDKENKTLVTIQIMMEMETHRVQPLNHF